MDLASASWLRTVERSLAPLRALYAAMLDESAARLAPLLARFGGVSRRIAVLEDDAILLHTVARDGSVALAARLAGDAPAPEHLRRGRLEARFPASCFLRRSLSVPQAGQAYLREIIEHRLERLTPWQPDKVLYGYSIPSQDEGAADLTVDLLVTARERVTPLLARLAASGLTPTALGSVEEPFADALAIDLHGDGPSAADPVLRHRIGRAVPIAFATLILAFATTGWFAASAEAELQETGERLAALQARVQAKAQPRLNRTQALLAAARPEVSMGAFLDKLSAALPDRTVLRELDVGPNKVRLLGRSADAPALVGPLESEAGLSSLRFSSAIVRDSEGRDLFDLAAERRTAPGAVP